MAVKNLLILFGGKSTEHEVSERSALYVIRNADREKYNPILLGITKEGTWRLVEDVKAVEDGSWHDSSVKAFLSPDAKEKCLYVFRDGTYEKLPVDVIFPVLHGLNGEDGTVQGLFTLSGIPYVGCGILTSAVSMDKLYTKIIVDTLGIRQADYVGFPRYLFEKDPDACIDMVEKKLQYPVFVKPSCAGSSIGVHKAEDRKALYEAIQDAILYDGKILVEETLVGREIECAVYGTEGNEHAAGIGEVIAAAEFYDYDAKYNSNDSQTDTDPKLPEGVKEEIMADAEKIFRAVGGMGLSRVDFFFTEKGVVFNEINTLPGFTSISMYPMIREANGLTATELIDELVEGAYQRREH